MYLVYTTLVKITHLTHIEIVLVKNVPLDTTITALPESSPVWGPPRKDSSTGVRSVWNRFRGHLIGSA